MGEGNYIENTRIEAIERHARRGDETDEPVVLARLVHLGGVGLCRGVVDRRCEAENCLVATCLGCDSLSPRVAGWVPQSGQQRHDRKEAKVPKGRIVSMSSGRRERGRE